MTGSNKFYNLSFAGGGAWSFADVNAEAGNNFTISSGTVTAPSTRLTVGGSFANSGTFTHNGGEVFLSATDSGNTLSGTMTGSSVFNKLTFEGLGGAWTFSDNASTTHNLTIDNGTTTLPASLTAGGDFTNSGTFIHNSGEVIFATSTTGHSINGGGSTFNNVTFNRLGGAWSPLTSTTTIAGNLTVASGTFNNAAGSANVVVNGNVTCGTSTCGTINFTTNTFSQEVVASKTFGPDISGATNWSFNNLIFHASSGSPTITFNGTNTGTTTASSSLQLTRSGAATLVVDDTTNNRALAVNGNVTVGAGTTLQAPSSATFNVGGNWTNSGTFTNGGGTITFNATSTGKTLAGTLTGTTGRFANLIFNGSGGAWSFSADAETSRNFTITAGTVTAPSGTLTIGGDYSNSGTFTNNSGLVKFSTTTTGHTLAGTMTSGSKFNNLTFDGVGGAWSFSADATASSSVIIENGTVTAPPGTLTIGGDYTNNGTFTHNSGLTLFNATDAGNTINGTLTSSSAFGSTTFNGANGAWTFVPSAAAISGNFTITNGTVTVAVSSTIGESFTQNGTFNANGGTITFNSTATGKTISGTLTGASAFASTTFNGSGGWTFSNNATTTGNFTITAGSVTLPPSLTIRGSYSNAGTITHSGGTVNFTSTSSTATINSGGTTTEKLFSNVVFNGTAAYTLQTSNIRATGTLAINNIGSFTLESGRTLETNGNYSICNGCTASTTWTGTTLFLNSGTNYEVGSKNNSAEAYGTLKIGANTDVRVWQTDAAAFTVDSTGSLYSQDHAALDGELYIYGDYHAGAFSSTTDYWSYATDFDGATGITRQARVFVETGATQGVTVDVGGTLTILGQGAGSGTTTITRIGGAGGSGGYSATINGALGAEFFGFDYLGATGKVAGVIMNSGASITELSNAAFDNYATSNATTSYVQVDQSLIGAQAQSKVFQGLTFNDTTGFAKCNFNATSTDVAGYWEIQGFGGNFSGEEFDCVRGTPDADPGRFKWVPTLTVSGIAYSDEGTTPLLGAVVKMVVEGQASSTATTTTSVLGAFTFLNVLGPTAGDTITVWIDGGTTTGATVMRYPSVQADVSLLNIYKDNLILRHDDAGPITNADLGFCDKTSGTDCADADLHFDVSGSALTVDKDWRLYINAGDTFTPGGAVTLTNGTLPSGVGGGLKFGSSGSTLNISTSTLTVGGDWINTAGGTFTTSTGQLTNFTGTTTGFKIDTAGAQGFASTTFDGVGGGWSASSSITINGNLAVTNGALSGGQNWTVNGGNVTGNGSLDLSSGTFTVNNTGNFGGNTSWSFGNLTFGSGAAGTTSKIGTGNITVATTTLTLSSSHTLNAGGQTWFIRGSASSPFSARGTFNAATSTFQYDGNNSGGNTKVASTTFYNIIFNNSGETFDLDGNTTSTATTTITAGTLDVTTNNYSLAVKSNWSKASGAAFTARQGTVIFTATGTGRTITGDMVGTSKFYNLTFNGSGGAWSFATSSAEAANDFTITTGTVTAPSSILYIGGNYSNSGTFTADTGTVNFNGTATGKTISGTLTGTSAFYNTTFSGSGGAWTYSTNATTSNNFTIDAGSVTLPTLLTIGGDYANNGGTLTHNSGTVIFNATDAGNTITGGGIGVTKNFNNVTMNGSGGAWTFIGNTEMDGDLTVSAGTLNGTAASTLTVKGGDITGNGTISMTSGTVNLQGSGSFGGNTLWSFANLTFGTTTSAATTTKQGTGGITISSSTLTLLSTHELRAGEVTWTLSGTTSLPFARAGIFDAGTSTFSFTGNNASGNVTLASTTYYNLITNRSGETFDLGGNTTSTATTTLTAGTLDATTNNYSFAIGGNLVNNATFTARSGTVTMNSTASGRTLSGTGLTTSPFYNLIFNGSGGAWTFLQNATTTNDFTITTGTVTATSSLSIRGSYSNSGTFTANSGNLNFIATGTGKTISGTLTGTSAFATTTFDGSGGGWTFNSNATSTGNFNITNGTLTATSSLTVGGNWTKGSGGIFTANSGTVVLNAGSAKTITGDMVGSSKFYNLTFNGSGGAWSFATSSSEAGNDFTITAGTVTAPSTQLKVGNNYTNNGTFTHNGGEVLMNATDSGNTLAGTMTGSSVFNKLTFDGIGGSWSFSSNASTTNNFTINAGTTTAPSSLTIGGDFANSDRFIHNSGTVNFSTTTIGHTIDTNGTSSTKNFNNVTFTGVGGAWTFVASNGAADGDFTINSGLLPALSR